MANFISHPSSKLKNLQQMNEKTIFKNFVLFSDEETFVAFHIPTSKIFRLNKMSFNIISCLKEGKDNEYVRNLFNISQHDIQHLIYKLENLIVNFNRSKSINCPSSIDRITIHVANDCNLACSYCYGKGGTYNRERKLMTKKTAKDLVKFIKNTFQKIDSIVFFGGEPLMNYKVIQTFCEEFRKDSNRFSETEFGIITNGTFLNSEIIQLINNHINTVVVSIDGPKEVNDLLRKHKNGIGSFNKIDRFIKSIKSETNTLVKYEATYTKTHQEFGCSKNDIRMFLHNKYNIVGSIVDEMMLDSYEERSPDVNTFSVSELIFDEENMKHIDYNTLEHIYSIAKGYKREMCKIGTKMIAVTTEGEFVPCHILLNVENFSLGSIYSKNIFNDKDYFMDKFPFLSTILKNSEPCTSCWAKNLCGGCALSWYYDFKTNRFLNEPHSKLCASSKEYFKDVILNLATIQGNKEKYNSFVNFMRKETKIELC